MTTTIAVINQKGGVGKTATTYHLARAAARRGLRTLCVDTDPQANLTSALAVEPVEPDQVGLADALSTRTPVTLPEVIVPGLWAVDVAPSNGGPLGVVRDEMIMAGGGETRLRDALATVAGDYDLVLIDCAPTLDRLSVNAYAAADRVAVVVTPREFALNGLAGLLGSVATVRQHWNPDLRVAGVLVNFHDGATVTGRERTDELHAADLPAPILEPPIPRRIVINDALEARRGLDEWGGADAYALADLYDKHLATLVGSPAAS